MRQENMVAIPKPSSPERIAENQAALELQLTPAEIAALDKAFPAPERAIPLQML